jgi:hypothetical protein
MTIEPDTKDWTWVIDAPCDECGLNVSTIAFSDIPAAIRGNADAWREVLTRRDVRDRPRPDVWSPLEYSCHVRDVFRMFDARLQRMMREDDPQFDNWDQDATAIEERYDEQDPATVVKELVAAAHTLAGRLGVVTEEEQTRPGRRSDGAAFTIDSLAHYGLHDTVHHIHDVGHVEAHS